MFKPIKSCLIVVLFGLLLQGCIINPNEVEQATTPSNFTPAATLLSEETITSTSFSFQENLSCWPIISLHKGNEIDGNIVFEGAFPESNFIWDPKSFELEKMPYNSIEAEITSISPDGQYVARLLYLDKKLLITSETGTKAFLLPENEEYGGIVFLSNESILITVDTFYLLGNYVQGTGFTHNYYILNLITDEVKNGSAFLPGFTMGDKFEKFPIAYSPDLQFVVYKTTPSENGEDRFVKVDLDTNNIVWTGSVMPKWDRDGRTLTYFKNNFFSISEDGKITQITDFKGESFVDYFGNTFSWSPNGRYLAFQRTQPSDLSFLYIWDNEAKIIFRPCLPDELRAIKHPFLVYWSFKSNNMLIRLVYSDSSVTQTPSELSLSSSYHSDFVLDLNNKIIFRLPYIDATIKPIGWLNWETP